WYPLEAVVAFKRQVYLRALHELLRFAEQPQLPREPSPAVLARFNLTLQALRRAPAAVLPVRSEPNVRPH
ncbi:MAG TPA: hypothetical protein PK403_13175, partial [Plasticicumulans sp.]|nr:hypothetical protein [Plasticicumulans sp.]